jgi:hypothetical protein
VTIEIGISTSLGVTSKDLTKLIYTDFRRDIKDAFSKIKLEEVIKARDLNNIITTWTLRVQEICARNKKRALRASRGGHYRSK